MSKQYHFQVNAVAKYRLGWTLVTNQKLLHIPCIRDSFAHLHFHNYQRERHRSTLKELLFQIGWKSVSYEFKAYMQWIFGPFETEDDELMIWKNFKLIPEFMQYSFYYIKYYTYHYGVNFHIIEITVE